MFSSVRKYIGVLTVCFSLIHSGCSAKTTQADASLYSEMPPDPEAIPTLEKPTKKIKKNKKIKSKKTKNAKPSETSESSSTESSSTESSSTEFASAAEPETVSANPRQGKIGFALNGGLVYLGAGGGAETWYSPSKKIDIGLRVLYGSGKVKASESTGLLETAELKVLNASANTRYFFTESIYALGGLGYSRYTGKYGFTVATNKEKYLVPVTASSATINIALGNMWKTSKGFVIGFDWVGYSYLAGLNAKIADPKTNRDQITIQSIRTVNNGQSPEFVVKQLLAKQSTYGLLLSLGYTF